MTEVLALNDGRAKIYARVMGLIDALKWRYATKSYRAEKVSKENLDVILEAARLAPTSSGLEPFEMIVITNAEFKKQIQTIANGQRQIVECSHLIVFAAWDTYTEARINAAFDQVNAQRGTKNEGWEKYRQFLLGVYPKRDARVNFEHAARQVYIAFAMAIAAAAELKIDATPMEGFDSESLDRLLDLPARGLKSVVILPIGYRNAEADWLSALKKVRRPLEALVRHLD